MAHSMTKMGLADATEITLLTSATVPARAQNAPPAPAVTVATPLGRVVDKWDEYTGRFEAVQQVEVRARVSGFIDSIHFTDGQMVKAGDLLSNTAQFLDATRTSPPSPRHKGRQHEEAKDPEGTRFRRGGSG